MSDETSEIKPWTIKGIVPEVRNAAIAAAARERQTVGAWLSRAILARVQAEQHQDRTPIVVASGAPTVVPSPDPFVVLDKIADLAPKLDGLAPELKRQVGAVIRQELRLLRRGRPGG